jgi:hypothetical protein
MASQPMLRLKASWYENSEGMGEGQVGIGARRALAAASEIVRLADGGAMRAFLPGTARAFAGMAAVSAQGMTAMRSRAKRGTLCVNNARLVHPIAK